LTGKDDMTALKPYTTLTLTQHRTVILAITHLTLCRWETRNTAHLQLRGSDKGEVLLQ